MEFNEIDNLKDEEILEIYSDYLEMGMSDFIATDYTWHETYWKCKSSYGCTSNKCAVYGNHEPDNYVWYFNSSDCVK